MATHPIILAMEDPMDRGVWRATIPGVTESRTQLSNETKTTIELKLSLQILCHFFGVARWGVFRN